MNNKIEITKGAEPIKPIKQKRKVLQTSNKIRQQTNLISLSPKHQKQTKYNQRKNQNQLIKKTFAEHQHNIQRTKERFSLPRTSQNTARTSRYSSLFKQQKHFQKQNGEQIRRHVDENLRYIYQFLSQRQLSLQLSNNSINQCEKLQGPKLQRNLVQRYVQLMFQEYQMPKTLLKYTQPNKLPLNNQSNQIHDFQTQVPIKPKQQPFTSPKQPIKKKAKNPTAKQLKSQFVRQMDQKPEHTYKPTKAQIKANNINKQINQQNSLYLLLQRSSQSKDQYRYCFICQCPILQSNMQYHQKEVCTQFNRYYSMNMEQLRNALMQKIIRIKQQIEKLYLQIFGDQSQRYLRDKINRIREKTKKYMNFIQQNLNPHKQKTAFKKDQLKKYFNSTTKTYQQSILKLYEKLRKLQWFVLTQINLQQKHFSASSSPSSIHKNRSKNNNTNFNKDVNANQNPYYNIKIHRNNSELYPRRHSLI